MINFVWCLAVAAASVWLTVAGLKLRRRRRTDRAVERLGDGVIWVPKEIL